MALMRFNNENAQNAGIGTGASTSGAYFGLLYAKAVTASTGSKGIEFSLKGEHDVNYLTCYYEKKDGSQIRGGFNIIQALMGIFQVNEINIVQGRLNDENCDVIPELSNKPVGLVLQKIMYTKNNEERSDGYKFDIVMPFNGQTRQTFKEVQENTRPVTVDKILATLEDKDERITKKAPGGDTSDNYGMAQYNETANRPVSKFDQLSQGQQQGGYNEPQLNQSDDEFFKS